MEKILKYLNTVLLVVLVIIGVSLLVKNKSFGALGEPNPTTLDRGEWTAINDLLVDDLEVNDDATIKGDTALTGGLTVGGNISVTGSIIGDQKVTAIAATNQYSTTTLTAAQSGTTFLISASGTRITLPASTTAEVGTSYRFQVKGAIDTASTTIASYEGDNIEGTLIVAGAVVDCAAEDFITLASDNENVGDYVEVMYDGTNWLIQDSGILTLATCTDPS
jgi:hypothetical protein